MARQDNDILDRLIANLSLRAILFHPATLFVVATAIMIGTAIFLWERQQEQIVNLDEFRLTAEKIRLTPPPNWADTDLKQLVLDQSTDSTPSILDTTLVSRTAGAIRKIGFVERVRSIQKSKSGLDIDLVYRQPVALVELSKVTIPEWPDSNRERQVLLPVDRHGVVMPESLGEQDNAPIITILYPAQFSDLTTWADWPDERIKDAASIASLFDQNATEPIGVKRIVTFRKPGESANAQIPFEIWSGTGTRIVWGNAPGKEMANESSAEAKIQAINELIAKYGALDAIANGRIDVRSGQAVVVGETKTASVPEVIFADLK
jgi:hypothetical protein